MSKSPESDKAVADVKKVLGPFAKIPDRKMDGGRRRGLWTGSQESRTTRRRSIKPRRSSTSSLCKPKRLWRGTSKTWTSLTTSDGHRQIPTNLISPRDIPARSMIRASACRSRPSGWPRRHRRRVPLLPWLFLREAIAENHIFWSSRPESSAIETWSHLFYC